MSWGPLLFGHADPETVEAVREAALHGTSFGAATEAEVELAAEIVDAVPSVEKVRLVSSGTEAAMSALRLARAFTKRDRILKIAGGYHGHADALLASAGSGLATLGIPASPGVPTGAAADTIVVPYNDLDAAAEAVMRYGEGLAAIIVEPVAANMGVVPPEPGYLETLRRLCDVSGALLDLRRGDHRLPRRARRRAGALRRAPGPDGARQDRRRRPAARGLRRSGRDHGSARAGRPRLPGRDARRAIRSRRLPASRCCGGCAIRPSTSELEARAASLEEGLAPFGRVQRVGALLTLFMADGPVRNFDDAQACDTERYAALFRHLLEQGVYLPPSQFEALFPSTAHGEEEIERTVSGVAGFAR